MIPLFADMQYIVKLNNKTVKLCPNETVLKEYIEYLNKATHICNMGGKINYNVRIETVSNSIANLFKRFL